MSIPHSRLATCPLTRGRKLGGERIPHPHHQFFREIGNSSRGFPDQGFYRLSMTGIKGIDSTRISFKSFQDYVLEH